MGSREDTLFRVLYIEQEDFLEDPEDYFCLSPWEEECTKHTYIIRCEQVIKDRTGDIVGSGDI